MATSHTPAFSPRGLAPETPRTTSTRQATTRPRPLQRNAADGETTARPDPDREAMLLMQKVLERTDVARSFARLAGALVGASATRASVQLRTAAGRTVAQVVAGEGGLLARYERMRKIARAAADAAIHVATHQGDQGERCATDDADIDDATEATDDAR